MLCITSFELMLSKPPSTHRERQQQLEGLHQEERAQTCMRWSYQFTTAAQTPSAAHLERQQQQEGLH